MQDVNTQRVKALIQGESVFPPVTSFFGHKHDEEQSPATLIAHLVRLQRAYDWDFVKVQSRATYYGEAWGCVHTYAFVGLVGIGVAIAQDASYPSRPITIVVSTGVGGPVDTNTRVLAQKLGDILGQSVIVQNRPGGGSVIGYTFAAKAPADGYTLHMWGAWLHAETGTQVTYVNYKGAAEATGDLMTGRVDATFGSLAFMAPFIQEGKLVPLAVGGKERSPLLPDVPTIVETGILPEFDAVYWVGYVAPTGTPRPVIEKLNAAFREILHSDEEKRRLAELGQTVAGGMPEEFSALIASEVSRWQKIVDKLGIRL